MLVFDKLDMLKCELFEQLMADMLYKGPEDARLMFLDELENEADNIVYKMFHKLCVDDGVECPYDEDAFTISRFEDGGIRFIEISVPESSRQSDYVLRAYVLTAHEQENSQRKCWRYFFVKKFREEETMHVIYVSPEGEVMLGSDLTDRINDKDYEHCAVAQDFVMVLLKELN